MRRRRFFADGGRGGRGLACVVREFVVDDVKVAAAVTVVRR